MRKLVIATAAVVATLGIAGTATAAPPEPQPWVCDGQDVEIEVHGRMGIIDGQKYLAHNLVVEGTFTPAEGEPEHFVDEQWMSGRTGGLDCVQDEFFEDEAGTTSITITLNAIPIGN
jgi:hypothetical protein